MENKQTQFRYLTQPLASVSFSFAMSDFPHGKKMDNGFQLTQLF